ncbi:MAG: glycosyltransferase [Puniceicoccaceae bacterium]
MAEIPKVCVITRTRNRPALLKRAIESILGQSMTDWQHVIVNDGGDVDELEAVCQKFRKAYAGRLRIMHEKHLGMQKASNTAIEDTDSVYVAIHDDDDTWHPDFLKRTTGFLNRKGVRSDYQGVISQTLRILETEQEDGSFAEKERVPYVPLREISLFRVGYENPFPPIAFLYRRQVHETIGLFDPKWDMAADLDFNYRFLEHFNIGVIQKPLAYYHWRDSSSKGTNSNTVTVKSQKHSQYLNELKNHYMRKSSSAAEAMKGLGFQVAGFLVENQWMMADLTRRAAETHSQVEALRLFRDQTLLPKLDGFADAIQAIGDSLAILNKAQELLLQNQDNLLQAGSSRDSHIGEVEALLKRLSTFQTDAIQPGIQALSEGIQNIADGLQNLHEEQLRADKQREDILQKGDSLQSAIKNLGDQVTQLEAATAKIDEQGSRILQSITNENKPIRETLERVENQLAQVGKFHTDSLWPKLDGFDAAIGNLGNAMGQLHKDLGGLVESTSGAEKKILQDSEEKYQSIREEQKEQASQLDSMRKEIVNLREQSNRQWQLGRFRIQWLGKSKDDRSDESSS